MHNRTPGKRGTGRGRPPWWRDPAILKRLERVERAHLDGRSILSIAVREGISERTIRDDLKRLQARWVKRIQDKQVVLRAARVRQLEQVRRDALEAATNDLLCEQAVLFGLAVTLPGRPEPVTARTDATGATRFHGNKAAALSVARQAVMDRAKLLGLLVDRVTPAEDVPVAPDLAALLQRAREGLVGGHHEVSTSP